MTDPITGGCQCGAVRYEITGPMKAVAHCHCSMCRKAHGALFVSFGAVDNSNFKLSGEENLGDYESSEGGHRRFCKSCGGQVIIHGEALGDETFVALGSLDAGQTPGHDPATETHIFWESKVDWYDPADGRKTVEGYGD